MRHINGRPQMTHDLLGRSDFRFIPDMASPRHGLAAPVEELAAGVGREDVDHGEKMSGSRGGGVDFRRIPEERRG